MKKLLILILVLAMAASLAGCTSFDNFKKTITKADIEEEQEEVVDSNTVKIGVFEPLTGDEAEAASDEVKGIELAHKLFKNVLAREVELVYADNESDTTRAIEAAQSLIDQNVSIVLGSYGNVLTMAALDTFEEAKMPSIVASCTNPLITTVSDYVARVAVIDAFQGNSAAKYIIEYLPIVLAEIDPEEEESFCRRC